MSKTKTKINFKKFFKTIFIFILVIILFLILKTFIFKGEYKEVEVEIPMGSSTQSIAKILKENDLIDSEILFRLSSKINDTSSKYRYGIFKFNTNMSTTEIMNLLMTGGATANTVTVTIPEGYTIKQMGEKFQEAGLFTKEEFYAACKNEIFDYEFLNFTHTGDYYLEGFLFPNTYEFYDDATPRDVIETMLDAFNENYSSDDLIKAQELGYSYRDVIIVASIIEREIKEPSERAMVAGVIYNRLRDGMALQMCSTIQYILGEQHDKLYDVDLQIDSPYNTYMYSGLPVGPISNPGKASIEAALNPVSHDYYYFVLMDETTGKHYFSKTFAEHSLAKAKYIK